MSKEEELKKVWDMPGTGFPMVEPKIPPILTLPLNCSNYKQIRAHKLYIQQLDLYEYYINYHGR